MPLRSVLLAAHVRALGIICGESEIVTGLVTNGRPERQDGERVIGLFLGTLPLRLRFAAGSWRELVAQVHEVEKQIERHRRFPLVEIQRLAGQALFETDFNFVHFHVLEQALRTHDKLQVLGGARLRRDRISRSPSISGSASGASRSEVTSIWT